MFYVDVILEARNDLKEWSKYFSYYVGPGSRETSWSAGTAWHAPGQKFENVIIWLKNRRRNVCQKGTSEALLEHEFEEVEIL